MASVSSSLLSTTERVGPPRMKEYILSEKLGQGTYASVYKGFRKGHVREVVAVKCITKKSLSKSSSENLLREIEILKGAHHENVVQLKDFQWDKDNVFLILEYCSGGDLSTYIARYKRLPERVARRFLRQLALALHFLRSQNIVHMDLKPQNLLIKSRENPILKVADFGFAQHLLGKEGRDSLRGSPLYMAVEMFLSESYDASVDLWSVGCILHEAIFGFAPFASKSFEELELKILSKEPILLPDKPAVTPECRDLLTGLLQRDPTQRMSFEAFFAHPFIDLEHAPSSECITKAIEIVTTAIKLDTEGKFPDALKLYCTSLEYFLPAIDYEQREAGKQAIRAKVKQYIDRAEQLKTALRRERVGVGSAQKERRVLNSESPLLNEARQYRLIGENFDEERQFGQALREYEKAIDAYLSVMQRTKKGPLKEQLYDEVKDVISRAEQLASYRDILDSSDDRTSAHNSYRCCIQ